MLNFFFIGVNFSLSVFLIGFWGVLVVSSNLIVVLMSIELMLAAISLCFLIYSCSFDDIVGQIFVLFILTVAAAESAIGLAILVVYYRLSGIIDLNYINLLNG